MNMLLLDDYSFGNRKAQVLQIQEGQYRVDYYLDNKLLMTHNATDVSVAKKLAEDFTDGRNSQLLNENA